MKTQIRIGILALCLLFCLQTAYADENSSSNSSVAFLEVVLPDQPAIDQPYNSLFRIRNLNYSPDFDSRISITVFYNLSREGVFVFEKNFTKTINSFSAASTGQVTFTTPGNYTLCGRSNISNSACKELNVPDPGNLTCYASLNISLPKENFSNGERVEIDNIFAFNGTSFPFVIQYWIEDLNGTQIKTGVNTSNLDLKSYTPNINEKEKILFAKNSLIFVGCNNTSPFTSANFSFLITNQDYVEPIQNNTNSSNETQSGNETMPLQKKNEILSFYTRTKNFNESINVYSNIFTKNGGLAILKGALGNYSIKLDGSEQNQQVSFNIKVASGSNHLTLELFDEDELSDRKELIFELTQKEPSGKSGGSSSGNKTKALKSLPKPKKDINVTKPRPLPKSNVTFSFMNSSVNLSKVRKTLTTPDEISGLAVYESPKARASWFAPYAALCAFGLIIAGMLFSRRGR